MLLAVVGLLVGSFCSLQRFAKPLYLRNGFGVNHTGARLLHIALVG